MHIFDKDLISKLKERVDWLLETINYPFVLVMSDKSAPSETNCDTLLTAAYMELDDDYLYCPSKEFSEKNDLNSCSSTLDERSSSNCHRCFEKDYRFEMGSMVMSRAIELHLNPGHSLKRSKVSTVSCEFLFFKGYTEGKQYKKSHPKLLNLKDFPSIHNFHDALPRYFDEFICALPFLEYSNPETVFLNLAAMLPPTISKPDLGLEAYISYGNAQERGRGNSVTTLHCDMSDAVNILLHNTNSDEETGALWGIFRREDAEKLEEYLFNYTEFQYQCGCSVDKVWNHGHLNVLEKPFLFLPDVHTKCEISK